MPDEKKQGWFSGLTPKLQKMTIIFSFIASFGASWLFLKAVGVDVLDFTIGCSSFSSQTEQNKNDIDTLKTRNHWKWQRQDTINANFEQRIKGLE